MSDPAPTTGNPRTNRRRSRMTKPGLPRGVGTFSGGKKCGNGVAAELLMQHGIKVYTEETITEEELIKILRNK